MVARRGPSAPGPVGCSASEVAAVGRLGSLRGGTASAAGAGAFAGVARRANPKTRTRSPSAATPAPTPTGIIDGLPAIVGTVPITRTVDAEGSARSTVTSPAAGSRPRATLP